jgi:hypothetical protein
VICIRRFKRIFSLLHDQLMCNMSLRIIMYHILHPKFSFADYWRKGPTVIWLTIYLNICYWINTPQTTCVGCHCYGLSLKYNYVNIICNYLSTLVSKQDFHVRWCSYLFTVTPRVSLVQQERINIWKNMSSLPRCSGIRVDQYLVFCVVFYRSLLVLFICFFGYCISSTSDYPTDNF